METSASFEVRSAPSPHPTSDLSTQQRAIVDLAVRLKLLIESVDAWLLTQGSLVDTTRNALIPVVKERMQLSDSLARYMSLLGLERRSRESDVAATLAALHGRPEERQERQGSQGSHAGDLRDDAAGEAPATDAKVAP